MTTEPGLIPQSPALHEAHGDSLAELFSRDPEGYSQQDLDRVVQALREQRARWAEVEAKGGRVSTPKAAKPTAQAILSSTFEELGL